MNDLSNAALLEHHTAFACKPIPSLAFYILIPLFFIGLSVSLFILIVVHNAVFLVSFLFLSTCVLSFIAWNTLNRRQIAAISYFLRSFPDSDLAVATDGQIVKITGVIFFTTLISYIFWLCYWFILLIIRILLIIWHVVFGCCCPES